MSIELTNPVLIVGIGGAGSKLVSRANETFGCNEATRWGTKLVSGAGRTLETKGSGEQFITTVNSVISKTS